MNLYILSYKKQIFEEGEWFDFNQGSRYTLYAVASNILEAENKFNLALEKLNKHNMINHRYVAVYPIKEIEAISVREDFKSTTVTGIWE